MQALRRLWSSRIADGGVVCRRCGNRITTADQFDLGHDPFKPYATHGPGELDQLQPEHRTCNMAGVVTALADRDGWGW